MPRNPVPRNPVAPSQHGRDFVYGYRGCILRVSDHVYEVIIEGSDVWTVTRIRNAASIEISRQDPFNAGFIQSVAVNPEGFALSDSREGREPLPLGASEFRVGDYVEATDEAPYGITHAGWRGRVIRVERGAITVEGPSEDPETLSEYEVNPRYFRLLESASEPSRVLSTSYANSPIIRKIVEEESAKV